MLSCIYFTVPLSDCAIAKKKSNLCQLHLIYIQTQCSLAKSADANIWLMCQDMFHRGCVWITDFLPQSHFLISCQKNTCRLQHQRWAALADWHRY